ncbi:uncharacterized protein LOC125088551 [Lutra lutra]|uniref:uncharacterized protein LOC125088551 n=1 Tax=Lutra lutra TaxID=9657 RepID=UPI001FD59C08|nr:uncharacterized protein LOC125088551 [Lutra lutra]
MDGEEIKTAVQKASNIAKLEEPPAVPSRQRSRAASGPEPPAAPTPAAPPTLRLWQWRSGEQQNHQQPSRWRSRAAGYPDASGPSTPAALSCQGSQHTSGPSTPAAPRRQRPCPYTAPEQPLSGEQPYLRSDLISCGLVLGVASSRGASSTERPHPEQPRWERTCRGHRRHLFVRDSPDRNLNGNNQSHHGTEHLCSTLHGYNHCDLRCVNQNEARLFTRGFFLKGSKNADILRGTSTHFRGSSTERSEGTGTRVPGSHSHRHSPSTRAPRCVRTAFSAATRKDVCLILGPLTRGAQQGIRRKSPRSQSRRAPWDAERRVIKVL